MENKIFCVVYLRKNIKSISPKLYLKKFASLIQDTQWAFPRGTLVLLYILCISQLIDLN